VVARRVDRPVSRPKVLLVCAVDVSIGPLLRPLIHALQEAGAEVHVACTPGGVSERLAEEGVPVKPVRIARRILSLRHPVPLVQLARLIRRERYDFVHVHTPIAAALGRAAARLSGARPVVLYTAHGFYFHDRMRPWLRRVLIWQERLFGRLCTDFLFTVSPEDRDTALRERIIDAERVHCLSSLGVDLERFDLSSPPSLRRADIGISDADSLVACIGRLVREKGVLDLIEAIALVRQRVPGTRLVVIGDTLVSDRGRGVQSEIRELIAAHGLENNVVFLGFREDVPSLLRLVDIFALPSYREGMPLTILEAMAAGKPVVATKVRGCREEVVDGVTGLLVEPGDVPGLAEAIRSLTLDPKRAKAMGLAGRAHVEKAFDQRRVLDEEVEAYRRLAKGHGKPWGTVSGDTAPSRSDSSPERRT
jgi:glycosyltransferase involved in cell wall biosynthesis